MSIVVVYESTLFSDGVLLACGEGYAPLSLSTVRAIPHSVYELASTGGYMTQSPKMVADELGEPIGYLKKGLFGLGEYISLGEEDNEPQA